MTGLASLNTTCLGSQRIFENINKLLGEWLTPVSPVWLHRWSVWAENVLIVDQIRRFRGWEESQLGRVGHCITVNTAGTLVQYSQRELTLESLSTDSSPSGARNLLPLSLLDSETICAVVCCKVYRRCHNNNKQDRDEPNLEERISDENASQNEVELVVAKYYNAHYLLHGHFCNCRPSG